MAKKLSIDSDASTKASSLKYVQTVKIKKERKHVRLVLPKVNDSITDVNFNRRRDETPIMELTVDRKSFKDRDLWKTQKQLIHSVDLLRKQPSFWDNCDLKRNNLKQNVDDADDVQKGYANLASSASNNQTQATQRDIMLCSLKVAGWLNVSNRVMSTKLFRAVSNSQYFKVQRLVKQGVSINVSNDAGQTLLMVALSIDKDESRDQMFQYLILQGVNCFKIDRRTGRDVLGWAAYLGYNIQVRRILDVVRGSVDLNRRDVEGRTALHLATLNGHVSVVETLIYVLLNYGLSLDVSDYKNVTPYMTARQRGHSLIARLLARGGACNSLVDITLFRAAPDMQTSECVKEGDPHLIKSQTCGSRDSRINSRRLPSIAHSYIKKYQNKRVRQHCNSNGGAPNSFKEPDEVEQKHVRSNPPDYHGKVQTPVMTDYINRNDINSTSLSPRYHSLRELFNIQSQDLCPSYRQLLPPVTPQRGASSSGSLDRESLYAGRYITSGRQSKRRQSSALSNTRGSAQNIRSRSRGERNTTSARSRCLSRTQSVSSIGSENNVPDMIMI